MARDQSFRGDLGEFLLLAVVDLLCSLSREGHFLRGNRQLSVFFDDKFNVLEILVCILELRFLQTHLIGLNIRSGYAVGSIEFVVLVVSVNDIQDVAAACSVSRYGLLLAVIHIRAAFPCNGDSYFVCNRSNCQRAIFRCNIVLIGNILVSAHYLVALNLVRGGSRIGLTTFYNSGQHITFCERPCNRIAVVGQCLSVVDLLRTVCLNGNLRLRDRYRRGAETSRRILLFFDIDTGRIRLIGIQGLPTQRLRFVRELHRNLNDELLTLIRTILLVNNRFKIKSGYRNGSVRYICCYRIRSSRRICEGIVPGVFAGVQLNLVIIADVRNHIFRHDVLYNRSFVQLNRRYRFLADVFENLLEFTGIGCGLVAR